ncbi:hypothetical protein PISMIDRAFT_101620, partial [Pisolithus microcarpus 441]
SAQMKAKLQVFWHNYEYLIIDKMSMIGKTFLAKLSRNITVGKMAEGKAASSASFGGINVIMCSDFHQFPPVAVSPSEALYVPLRPQSDLTLAQVGHAIYDEFQTVMVLKEQMHIMDQTWLDFLNHLRMGRVQEHHITMLRTLVLTNPVAHMPDFTMSPWADASLVTPRHAMCQQWNNAALCKHVCLSAGIIFVCAADDTVKGEWLSLEEHFAFVSQMNGGHHQKGNLPDSVEISLGMKVMVMQNVETDLDIMNRACGIVVDILLHLDEPTFPVTGGAVHLKHLPLYILVKLCRICTSHLPGLQPSVILVKPVSKTYHICYTTSAGVKVTCCVQCLQYPMTSAYAFTDYWSQGQTISHVLVDIAQPPTGGLNLFNLYVALSRSSGHETIRLL